MWIFLLIALAVPAFGQFQSAEIRFEGIGCEPCLASLPDRLGRVRGVESAKVELEAGLVRVKFAEQNRVRIEQLRDIIQQDGTKAVSAVVTVRGEITQVEGRSVLRFPSANVIYLLSGERVSGDLVIGKITNLRAESPLMITVTGKQ